MSVPPQPKENFDSVPITTTFQVVLPSDTQFKKGTYDLDLLRGFYSTALSY
jgi:hypothetical protein